MPDDDRDVIYVHTDHNASEVQSFYEIPDRLAEQVRGDVASDPRTFAQALTDLVAEREHLAVESRRLERVRAETVAALRWVSHNADYIGVRPYDYRARLLQIRDRADEALNDAYWMTDASAEDFNERFPES